MTQKKLVLQNVQVMATQASEPKLHPQAVPGWHEPLVYFGVKPCLLTGGFVGSQVFSVETQAKKKEKEKNPTKKSKSKCSALITKEQPII